MTVEKKGGCGPGTAGAEMPTAISAVVGWRRIQGARMAPATSAVDSFEEGENKGVGTQYFRLSGNKDITVR